MSDDVRALARIGAVQAAVVTGVIHLAEGLPRLVVYLPRASLADPRPYLFVPSAVALLAAAAAVYSGRWVRSAAAVGATVSAAYLVGYAWWHLTDHGGLIPAHEAADPLGELAGHLAADPVALVAAAAETLGLVAFGALAVAGAGERSE